MRLNIETITPVSSVDGISLSQTPAAGGVQALTITGSLASGGAVSLDHGHLLEINSTADDSVTTFTVTGTNNLGVAISETITGPNTTTVTGTYYFKTISQILVSGNTVGAVKVGVLGKASSKAIVLSSNDVGIHCIVGGSGSVTYSIQETMDNTIENTNLDSLDWLNDDVLVGQTTSQNGSYVAPVFASRLITTAFSSPATVKYKVYSKI